jgi:hypothetical protein
VTDGIPFKLWSASVNGAEAEAERLLAEAEKRNEAAMVDLGHGRLYRGWHPLVGRLTVSRKGDEAPAHLPPYLARLDDAQHVHAAGSSAEDATAELLALFKRVAERLERS